MTQPRSKSYLFTFFQKIGYAVEPSIMDEIFYHVSPDGETASIQSFRVVLNEYLDEKNIIKPKE